MIYMVYKGKTYRRTSYHWMYKTKGMAGPRKDMEIWRRLTHPHNGARIKDLELQWKRFMANLQPPM